MHPLRSSRRKGKIIAITLLEGIRAHLPNRHQNMIEDSSAFPHDHHSTFPVNRCIQEGVPTMYRLYVRVGVLYMHVLQKNLYGSEVKNNKKENLLFRNL